MIQSSNADKASVPLDAGKIRSLRISAKLTQADVAKRAGLPSAQYVSDIERGIRLNLTIETLERIARALGVSARELLKN